MKQSSTPLLVLAAPVIFVVLWATGFVGAKFGMRDAEPFTFLAVRFGITTVILGVFVTWTGRIQNADRHQLFHSFFIGCLLHGIYLGGIFWAINEGMAAGISSLIVGLQPFFTAIFAWMLLSEKLPPAKAVCFVAALAGVVLVLFPDLDFVRSMPGVNFATVLACITGVLSISLGAVYQKRAVQSLDLWSSTTAQFAGATVLTAVLALLLEENGITFTSQVVLTQLWLIFVLSIGAIVLLMYLIRRGDTASVASLFFLVPVVAMIMSWFLFGEELVPVQFAGSAIVVASVAVASRIK